MRNEPVLRERCFEWVGFYSDPKSWPRVTACLLASLFLASCALVTSESAPYPAAWASIQAQQARGGDSCPWIEGVYRDLGEYGPNTVSGRPCVYEAGECTSLIFGLLSDARVDFNRSDTDRPLVDEVRIAQPAPGTIEITTRPAGETQILSMSEGDFTCDQDGLRLKEKSDTMIVVISNAVSHEVRTFNVAVDGSLVMKSQWHNQGLHTVIPYSVTNEGWVRWARVSSADTEPAAVRDADPDN